jgi:hypothetical protein
MEKVVVIKKFINMPLQTTHLSIFVPAPFWQFNFGANLA